ncbi:redoxin domain-containing protein [Flexithrix dorotheae]|uniref:redoxin domain-containing protein n=1 Tax=Flexithrix dorotheae TaxID=70993 RepID=UPI0003629BB3|nr:redoxin domain-containing protein [Flexithrix dorotheae]
MKLVSGQQAIDFEAKDIHGNHINLNNLKGEKILLSFFRSTACPFCNLRIYQLKSLYPKVKDNLKMVFIFESKKDALLRSPLHGELPMPLISDFEKDLHKSYGIEFSLIKTLTSSFNPKFKEHMKVAKELGMDFKTKEKGTSNTLMPADFLIDEHFNIVHAHYGKAVNEHIDMEIIKDFAGQNNSLAA